MEHCHIAHFILMVVLKVGIAAGKNVFYIHWNKNNPMFRIDNTDHIVDVNRGNLPWEYDQVNLICPVSEPGSRHPESHVVYSVTKEEYESCRITNPNPRIVAVCNQPHRLKYFTITFRSFTPTPGGLEFHPGHDYYFISTSSREDLHRRVGGGCSTHHMRMIFKVHDNSLDSNKETSDLLDNDIRPSSPTATPTTTTARPIPSVYRGRTSTSRAIYYYHPRDLIELENSLSDRRRRRGRNGETDSWRNEALRYTSEGQLHSASSKASASSMTFLALTVLSCLMRW